MQFYIVIIECSYIWKCISVFILFAWKAGCKNDERKNYNQSSPIISAQNSIYIFLLLYCYLYAVNICILNIYKSCIKLL